MNTFPRPTLPDARITAASASSPPRSRLSFSDMERLQAMHDIPDWPPFDLEPVNTADAVSAVLFAAVCGVSATATGAVIYLLYRLIF